MTNMLNPASEFGKINRELISDDLKDRLVIESLCESWASLEYSIQAARNLKEKYCLSDQGEAGLNEDLAYQQAINTTGCFYAGHAQWDELKEKARQWLSRQLNSK
jgi:hypothetical protein